jgi:hypothetical protein
MADVTGSSTVLDDGTKNPIFLLTFTDLNRLIILGASAFTSALGLNACGTNSSRSRVAVENYSRAQYGGNVARR